MNGSLLHPRLPRWAAASLLAAAAVIAAVLLVAAALDAGYFRGALIDALISRSGRRIQVTGLWQLRLLSEHPRLTAEGVIIGNPAWTPAGNLAEIGRVSLTFRLPWLSGSAGIDTLEMQNATLHLIRDAAGRANWQLTDPNKGAGKGIPLFRSVSMPKAHVELDDARRHLRFKGIISIGEAGNGPGSRPLQIDGTGQLNGRADTFGITGDPLAAVIRDRPYHFAFEEHSSGSILNGHGALLYPLKFDNIDATFDAVGDDLKDIYFLTGVTLVNTARYHLSGSLARRGTNTRFNDVRVASGQSDLQANVAIESGAERSKLVIDLKSTLLRTADIGVRAAGREAGTAVPMVLSDAMINPEALRRADAEVTFNARTVTLARVSLQEVSARMNIERGMVTVAPLHAGLLDGTLNARMRLDATQDTPAADIDLDIKDAQIALVARKAATPPPMEGLLRARLRIKGYGRSMHQVAASANGALTGVLPHGTLRASLAELIGLDLRALGLLAAKNSQETQVRCGVASFQARDGVFTAQNLLVDTDTIQITGDGLARLDSESLDFRFSGHPKTVRLARLRSPILLGGTLSRPTLRLDTGHIAMQAMEAVAAGAVLTPLAAVLAFVDPGLTKDADCGALIAKTQSSGSTRKPADR